MTRARLTIAQYEALPWCHVRGTATGHDDIHIIGTRRGLSELRDLIERAMDKGEAGGQVFHCGGEGSGVKVQCTNLTGLRAAFGDHDD